MVEIGERCIGGGYGERRVNWEVNVERSRGGCLFRVYLRYLFFWSLDLEGFTVVGGGLGV